MVGRIFLANVGVNASHRISSPIFPDGSFEFIPIPEAPDLKGPEMVRYRDLRSYNSPRRDLREFIPKRMWDRAAHNDPEFETFTYGDNCESNPRAASLKRIRPGDFLFFLARMTEWRDGRPGAKRGFYLVGFLEIEKTLRDVRARPNEDDVRRFGANAHVRRGLADPGLWDRFWVFGGSGRSRRFDRAVPVTRELAVRVFESADGSPWRWDRGRTELQVIGSYTRSCRCVIGSAGPGDARRAEALWGWVARHSG